ASASLSTPMICSSENLVLFISSVLLSGPDSNPTWRKIRGSRHNTCNPLHILVYLKISSH
ncbi:MAG: hypothetical protein ACI8QU_000425, partial [Devosia litorisediminis]